jgi:ribosome biogenesis ATPase
MSGMNRRTNNISLNSPLATPPITSTNGGLSTPNDQPIASTSFQPLEATDSQADSSTPNSPKLGNSSTSKRKLRVTRDPSTPKRSKPSSSSALLASDTQHAPPATRLADLGGVDACIESMLELVALPLCHPEVYLHTGVRPPRGVLLVGPPGCGKTMLAGAIAGVR